MSSIIKRYSYEVVLAGRRNCASIVRLGVVGDARGLVTCMTGAPGGLKGPPVGMAAIRPE